jgi:hypothetical protein
VPQLLDAYIAHADAAERHAIEVNAPAPVVLRAVWTADLGGPIARALLAVRGLPSALASLDSARERLRALRQPSALTLRDLQRTGFTVLAEDAGRELVLGLTGRFWTPTGCLLPTDPATWAAGPPPGNAQAAWSFAVAPGPGGRTELVTETRVRCADAAARRAFRRYWLVVRPFSGLLRLLMLRSIRREAELT